MSTVYCIALDTHVSSCEMAVVTSQGKVVRRTRCETAIPALVEALDGVRRPRKLTFEEGPLADWLARELRSHVDELLVCGPRRNRLIAKEGDKDDPIDTEKLAHLYRGGYLYELLCQQEGEIHAELVRLAQREEPVGRFAELPGIHRIRGATFYVYVGTRGVSSTSRRCGGCGKPATGTTLQKCAASAFRGLRRPRSPANCGARRRPEPETPQPNPNVPLASPDLRPAVFRRQSYAPPEKVPGAASPLKVSPDFGLPIGASRPRKPGQAPVNGYQQSTT